VVYGVAIDERANAVVVDADDENVVRTDSVAAELTALLGVTVVIRRGQEITEAACSWSSCSNPMRAGAQISDWQLPEPYRDVCTMGFHVRDPSTGSRQFVTTGHCGFNGESDSYFNLGKTWYMTGYGEIGDRTASFYNTNYGWDIMRVEMPDGQASNRIVGTEKRVTAHGNPITGEPACVSLGEQAYEDCGYVDAGSATWGPAGTLCNCVLSGARFERGSVPGDSGSPVYRPTSATSATALALMVTNQGHLTKLKLALDTWDWTVIKT
jgi:hypothetical protein